MSKAIVNMTPNPSDIQTIHCSQGDTDAREWEFELHNNGEVIDADGITDQIVFKAYEGGTEELLPSSLMNGSVDLGSLTWTFYGANNHEFTAELLNMKVGTTNASIPSLGVNAVANYAQWTAQRPNDSLYKDSNGKLHLRLNPYTTVAELTSALQGVYLWYETTDSTPTTTPINADIKYPQGLLTEQEFTYRESPTEEDGLANIVGIKGQTLKWNQLSQSSRDTYTAYGLTISCTDGLWSFQGTYTGENGSAFRCGRSNVPILAGHKVLLLNTSPWKVRLQGNETSTSENTPQNRIIETQSGALADIVIHAYGLARGDTVDVQCRFGIIDLTVMFGETKANEIYAMEQATEGSGVDYFKSLFPLDYYPYNVGSLIPFMGNGIKTVGKNQINLGDSKSATANGVTASYDASTQKVTLSGTNTKTDSAYILINFTPSEIPKFKIGETYVVSASSQIPTNTYFNLVYRDTNNALQGLSLTQIETRRAWRFTVPSNYSTFNSFQIGILKEARQLNGEFGVQLEFGSTATAYEPYTESVLNLPISTYFPSGMKDVPDYTNGGKIYDEMTSNKADTRVGSVDLGTLNWTTYSSPERHVFRAYILSNMKQPNGANLPNAMCSRYEPMAYNPISANDDGYFAIGAQRIVIIEHDYTDPVAFKESLSNVYLYYELATSTETSFTTASLVTENAEIPLSNEDGVLIGKCTEELSADAGFIEGKIKLSDEDGDVYSNKIQIHVERSPQ